MTIAMTAPALHELASLYRGESSAGLSDEGLLRRFVDALDLEDPKAADAAFAALIGRHGPMVLGVCRRALDDPNDVDDAFQAVFLVLVRRARTVRVEGTLGRWLYGVARKVASRARAQAARRRARLVVAPEDLAGAAPVDGPEGAELRVAIDEELARLPERYRSPILLCGLIGLSYEDAAARLRWPVGTLKSRLSRGRDQLADRLARRGIAPTLVVPALRRAAPAVPAPLASATLASVRGVVAGLAVPGALRVLARPRLVYGGSLSSLTKGAALASLALGLAGMTQVDGRRGGAEPPPVPARAEAPAVASAKDLDPATLKPAEGCSWEIEPHAISPGDSARGQSGKDGPLAYDVNVDSKTGAIKIVLVRARGKDQPEKEFRLVVFDRLGRRHEPKPLQSLNMGGDISFAMTRYDVKRSDFPEPPSFLGVELVTADAHRSAGIKAREEAKAAGLSILPPARVGEPFAFDLPLGDGRRIRSAELKGKVVVVDGWATWCTPCMAKMPGLKDFSDAHRAEGFQVVGVCFSDPEASRNAARGFGIDWPQVYVPRDEESQRLWFEGSEIPNLPHILLIDRAGILRAVCQPDEVEARSLELLREPTPAS